MKKEQLTLKSTNEVKASKKYCIIDIEEGKIIDGKLENILSEEIIDDFDNYYVRLPPLFVKALDNNQVMVSHEEFEGSIKLVPQLISKYKNYLIKGQCRSIPNVAPNSTQFSYSKAKKLAKLEILKTKAEYYYTLASVTTEEEKEKCLALAKLYVDKYNKEVEAYNRALARQKERNHTWIRNYILLICVISVLVAAVVTLIG